MFTAQPIRVRARELSGCTRGRSQPARSSLECRPIGNLLNEPPERIAFRGQVGAFAMGVAQDVAGQGAVDHAVRGRRELDDAGLERELPCSPFLLDAPAALPPSHDMADLVQRSRVTFLIDDGINANRPVLPDGPRSLAPLDPLNADVMLCAESGNMGGKLRCRFHLPARHCVVPDLPFGIENPRGYGLEYKLTHTWRGSCSVSVFGELRRHEAALMIIADVRRDRAVVHEAHSSHDSRSPRR